MIKRKRITLGLSYAQARVVVCDWCGRLSMPVIDYRSIEELLSRPDRFGHYFTFRKPGPDGMRHECHWCRWEREWQAELEAIRQQVRERIERERQAGQPPPVDGKCKGSISSRRPPENTGNQPPHESDTV